MVCCEDGLGENSLTGAMIWMWLAPLELTLGLGYHDAELRSGERFYFNYWICMSVLVICISVYHMCSWCPWNQKRVSHPLELEF